MLHLSGHKTVTIPMGILITLAAAYFSLTLPAEGTLDLDFEHLDKVLHICGYFFMTLTYFLNLRLFSYRANSEIKAAIFAFTISLTLELLQLIPKFSRSFDFYDLLANMVGVSFALISIYFFRKANKFIV